MIKIEHLDFANRENYEDTLIQLHNIATSCKDKKLHEEIRKLANDWDEIAKEYYKAEDDYMRQWRGLIGKYYKINYYRETETGTYSKTEYIYPYDIIEANETLWLQTVDPESNYKGGVKDGNISFEKVWWYDIELEEISKDEFEKQAYLSTSHVIERRPKRELEKKEHEYHINY